MSLYGRLGIAVTAIASTSEPLPPETTFFDVLLGVVRTPPPVVMEIMTKMPVTIVPMSNPPSASLGSIEQKTSSGMMYAVWRLHQALPAANATGTSERNFAWAALSRKAM